MSTIRKILDTFTQADTDLLYQPLENQRLSTTNDVLFSDLETTNKVTAHKGIEVDYGYGLKVGTILLKPTTK